MGGKPNPGTSPDKRLKANKGGAAKPAMPAAGKKPAFPGAAPPFTKGNASTKGRKGGKK